MKYIVILCDGMADEPLEELDGRTPLEAARTVNMDRLAADSEIGMVRTVPEGMAPGSDTANLSVIGYDPRKYYSGRSPLEALSIGAEMGENDVSFRCNLVTLSEEEDWYEDRVILDHSSGEIPTEEAAALVEALREGLGREGYTFYVGTSYRHLLIQKDGKVTDLTPPHDILTKRIGEYLPEDPVLREMMVRSYEILKDHPVNVKRRAEGKNPANSAWFWGAGTRPALPSFEEKTGVKGAMISAVDLLKGIAAGSGMHNIIVEGANGGLHTNYAGKARAAVKALTEDGYDFVYVHIEAPDEMGHQGSAEDKIKAIEYIDDQVIGPVADALRGAGVDFRMLILPDHPTPVRVRTHTSDPVPYLLYDSTKAQEGCSVYSEKTGRESGKMLEEGYRLIDHLLNLDLPGLRGSKN
ncbi:MAG TPA: cofactor-independent phosphoglycerate mutase [Candidatus Mediterraneibacter caccavium]|uniref:Cofactor-independent phosphoglycerate mutase n=1 Tax=Candidatus Mediterraneibacter caccavium TaxID=2838661 RepID=A0A9D1VYZ7_9FIRM|nr:cofactor-independent phosphoglycerate mutase [Lachnoclostridium sp. An76]OUN35990.1 cofactor-independent phosphoglycerate mutase [Lachnoclostridium sp. An76]HIX49260.1 cofactor-independent phosphoglycerate mutase [Candidatus Mediterraneibacter caccavium]